LFLYVHWMDVHDWYTLGDPVRSPTRVGLYRDAVARLDALLGRFLDDLRSRGLLEHALVIVTADHGEALQESHPIPPGPMHFANPAYEPVMRVPLILWPKQRVATDVPWRSEDLHRWLLARVGAAEAASPTDELFVTELRFQTFRSGQWKLVRPRDARPPLLFDLAADPHEVADASARHPDQVARLVARVDALAASLAARPSDAPLSEKDAARLRAPGYLTK
jgi:arylsulfatase A-like enzyme